ncbi:bifunctional GDP-fucose synthetase: GDP-4-dehydro-6-deoxy-D-mannose epimerase and GDP-4-dehydro-6-L-deoxygalactose reductase [uncultured Desulfatiglans sp.]|nr:bifunctional GDP-fucose synthetase: GDP-4-dehydro-6-deoxy-D-mannose epimerase and GDP-4-dehydro-6-L-deoxygalactose reductase [uncultured Desulfatiglans sp.]
MMRSARIFVAGHRGMVGSAILRRLRSEDYTNIVTRTHADLDLLDQQAVRAFFTSERIDQVVLAAARVGGIWANNAYPAEFIYQNLMIETNVIHEAWRAGVERLLFLGSSCIYPKFASQPMQESCLLTGPLEPTNEPYAIAKIAGIKLCESYNRQYGTRFRSVMPTNLYGPHDNYDLRTSHVLPALIRKCHLAKCASNEDWEGIRRDEALHGPIPEDVRESLGLGEAGGRNPRLLLWGTGGAYREFLHVDDMASASAFVMSLDDDLYNRFTEPMLSHINVGSGEDLTIAELANMTADVVGYRGEIVWDASKPDGTPRKLLDVSRLRSMGWRPRIGLREGIEATYRGYCEAAS